MKIFKIKKKFFFCIFSKACGELADDAKVTIPDEFDVLTIVNQFGHHDDMHKSSRNKYLGEEKYLISYYIK